MLMGTRLSSTQILLPQAWHQRILKTLGDSTQSAGWALISRICLRRASLSLLVREHAWGERRAFTSWPIEYDILTRSPRLAWMELHTSLAKVFYKYDVELMNTEVDWQRDAEMHLLWRKPQLMARISERK